MDGTVLSRSVEPGEVVLVGASLMSIGDPSALRITVFVPEDRYGQIRLGDTADVTVDSFEGETFEARVLRIAEEAEFTPRNVQTEEGRRTTVFAVELSVMDPQGRLKPGMPADVDFRPVER
jgi:multidrug resistance efflux pump